MAFKCSSIFLFSFLSATSSNEALSCSFAAAARSAYKQGESGEYQCALSEDTAQSMLSHANGRKGKC